MKRSRLRLWAAMGLGASMLARSAFAVEAHSTLGEGDGLHAAQATLAGGGTPLISVDEVTGGATAQIPVPPLQA